MMGLSAVHMLIFGIVAILLFGNRLPSVARSLGRSLVEFKKGMNELENEFKSSVYSEPTTTPRVAYTRPQRTGRSALRTAEGAAAEPKTRSS